MIKSIVVKCVTCKNIIECKLDHPIMMSGGCTHTAYDEECPECGYRFIVSCDNLTYQYSVGPSLDKMEEIN